MFKDQHLLVERDLGLLTWLVGLKLERKLHITNGIYTQKCKPNLCLYCHPINATIWPHHYVIFQNNLVERFLNLHPRIFNSE